MARAWKKAYHGVSDEAAPGGRAGDDDLDPSFTDMQARLHQAKDSAGGLLQNGVARSVSLLHADIRSVLPCPRAGMLPLAT